MSKITKKRKSVKQKNGRRKDYELSDILKAIDGCGGIVAVVARRLMCSIPTAQKYIDKYPDAVSEFENERLKMIDLAEEVILRKIKKGDAQIAKWYLSKKAKDRGYGDEIGVFGNMNIDLNLDVWAEKVKKMLLEGENE